MELDLNTSLVLLTIACLNIWYLKYLWSRRKLYIYSWSVPGPFSLPIVGTFYKFIGKTDDILNCFVNVNKSFPVICKWWFGPYLVYVVQDPDYIKTILTSQKCLGKSVLYKYVTKTIGSGLLTSPVPIWKRHRKMIAPTFNQKLLDHFVQIFAKQATIFTEVLHPYSGQKGIDISTPANALTMDSLSETIIGLKLNTQGGDYEFIKNLDRAMQIIMLRSFKLWLQVDWIWRFHPLKREFDKCVTAAREVPTKVIREKKEILEKTRQERRNSLTTRVEEKNISVSGGGKKKVTLLDLILENFEFTEQEIQDEIEIFLIAGMDTTAYTLCFCFEMMAMHQEVQQKVHEEVVNVVGEERQVEVSDLPYLKYTERVIKETLRLFPIAVYFARNAEADIELGNYIIPENSTIVFSSLNIHRNAKYWPEPLKFDPDRFLPEEIEQRHPCCYIAFSYGPRNCIGVKYAMMNLKTIIATVIRKYRLFTEYKCIEDIELETKHLIRPKHGFKVHWEHRVGSTL